MGSNEDSKRYPENSVLGHMGYVAPNFEDIMDGLFPEGSLNDQAKIFVRGYRYLRKAEFFLTGIGVGVLWWSASTDNWVPSILCMFFGLMVVALIDVGKAALKEAIETEGERCREIVHYRELNQTLCLREFEKGKQDDGSGDAKDSAGDGDLREG